MSKSDAQSSTNAKLLSIIAENGTQFRPNQKIIFNLDPSIGWIKTKESYLVFDILNYSTSNMRLMLAEAGISFNPQYEVPSVNTLYITSMSVFGRCQDEGYIKIVKYTYKDPAVSNALYKVLDKFSVSPNMNFNRKCDFVIGDGERIAILRKSTITPQGQNDITIQLYGTQKLTNLDIQSSI